MFFGLKWYSPITSEITKGYFDAAERGGWANWSNGEVDEVKCEPQANMKSPGDSHPHEYRRFRE